MKNIKNFIFDFGEVLYDVDRKRTLDAFVKLSKRGKEIIPEMMQLLSNNNYKKLETGDITPREFRDILSKEFSISATDKEFDDAWNASLISPYSFALDSIKKFKQYGKVFMLSNTNEIHMDFFLPQSTELLDEFDKVFFSCRIGFRKPDRDCFLYVLDDIDANPEETLFVDDLKDNIEAAKELSINTFHVSGANNVPFLLNSLINKE